MRKKPYGYFSEGRGKRREVIPLTRGSGRRRAAAPRERGLAKEPFIRKTIRAPPYSGVGDIKVQHRITTKECPSLEGIDLLRMEYFRPMWIPPGRYSVMVDENGQVRLTPIKPGGAQKFYLLKNSEFAQSEKFIVTHNPATKVGYAADRGPRMPAAVQREIRGKIKRGELSKHGYAMHISASKRREALKKAVDEDGAPTVYRRLLLLRLWNREQNPKLAKIADDDAMWVGKTYGVKEDGFRFTPAS